MKKISIFGATLAIVAGMSSCQSVPTASFKSDIDSVAYAYGVVQAAPLDQYFAQQLRIEQKDIPHFRKGFLEGVHKSEPDNKERAYSAGKEVGMMVATQFVKQLNMQIFGQDSIIKVSKNDVIAGFLAALDKDSVYMDPTAANVYLRTNMQIITEKALRESNADYIAENEKWLADNKKKDSIQVKAITVYDPLKKDSIQVELQYKVLKEGKGEKPTATDRVKVNYEGKLIDGTVFDSSYKRGTPATFGVSQVIKGWTEALKMMPVGSVWEVYIPERIAYGMQQNQGTIKPFSTLQFKVELLEIEKPAGKK